MSSASPIDVTALVADIRRAVAERRRAGGYPQGLLRALRAEFRVGADQEPLEVRANIATHLGVHNTRPVVGPGIVFLKRALRRTIAWYVQPIAFQQSRFNNAATHEIRALERRVAQLEVPWRRGVRPETNGDPERVAALVRRLENLPSGDVVQVEAEGTGLGVHLSTELSSHVADAIVRVVGDPLADLTARAAGSLGAVLLPGVLGLLPARGLIDLMPLAATRLRPGGRVVLDVPQAVDGADPSSVDPAMVRWVAADTVRLLCESAGLVDITIDDGAWTVVTATRSGA